MVFNVENSVRWRLGLIHRFEIYWTLIYLCRAVENRIRLMKIHTNKNGLLEDTLDAIIFCLWLLSNQQNRVRLKINWILFYLLLLSIQYNRIG